MNLGEARTDLKARGYDEITDARANAYLNGARRDFDEFSDWPWLVTTTTGTAPLTIPDLREVIYVADTTLRSQLSQVDVTDLLGRDASLTLAGNPSSWWLDNLTVNVWPLSATDSLTVRYVKRSPVLADDTDTPLFPEDYHDIWVTLAESRAALQDDENQNQSVALRQQANLDLQQIADRLDDGQPSMILLTDSSEDW